MMLAGLGGWRPARWLACCRRVRRPRLVVPIVVTTLGYALFQTANNTAVMADVRPDERGVMSGMLNLSRNLGLITGASLMGAVFAFASATTDIATASPDAVATGMRITFAVAAALIVAALGIAASAHVRRAFGSATGEGRTGARARSRKCPTP